jgi:hypothetical protein
MMKSNLGLIPTPVKSRPRYPFSKPFPYAIAL